MLIYFFYTRNDGGYGAGGGVNCIRKPESKGSWVCLPLLSHHGTLVHIWGSILMFVLNVISFESRFYLSEFLKHVWLFDSKVTGLAGRFNILLLVA